MVYLQIFLIGAWVAFACLLGCLMRLFFWGTDLNYYVSKWIWRGMMGLLHVRVRVENFEGIPRSPCVLVANHQSALDLGVFGKMIPHRTLVIAKRELRWVPFLGWALWMGGNVFIHRKRRTKALAGMEVALKKLKESQTRIWIFPEGTRRRSRDVRLLPFKKGAFHLAIDAQVPIVPIVAESFEHIVDWRLKRAFHSGVIRIRVLDPVATSGLGAADVATLAETVRQKMLHALDEFSNQG